MAGLKGSRIDVRLLIDTSALGLFAKGNRRIAAILYNWFAVSMDWPNDYEKVAAIPTIPAEAYRGEEDAYLAKLASRYRPEADQGDLEPLESLLE
jgi:hypothetical protein